MKNNRRLAAKTAGLVSLRVRRLLTAPAGSYRRRRARASWLSLLAGLLALVTRSPVSASQGDGSSFAANDDFTYFGGPVWSRESWPSSSAWGIAFRQTVLPHFAWSLSYLNDGHFPGHHRDGVTGEVWLPFNFANEHVTVSLGGGPFYYFDTQYANNPSGFADVHAWTWLLSADLRVHLWSRASEPGWFVDLRYDWSSPSKDIETHSLFWGVGYRMYSDFTIGSSTQNTVEGFAQNEVAGYYGKTVVNSLAPPASRAEAVEYRRQVGFEFTRLSVSFLNEGNSALIRRNGITYEAWLEPSFWEGNASLGGGFGGYTAVDKYQPSAGRHVSYVVSATLSARFLNLIPGIRATELGQRVNFRFTWHRIVTDYNRDTDILLFGLGCRF
jgi:hypothetical protein